MTEALVDSEAASSVFDTQFADALGILNLESSVRVEFEVIKPTGVLYLGYRQIRATFKDGNKVKLDDHLHLGLRINF